MDAIDLRSDTVSQPSLPMRLAIGEAPVGDDSFGEDPSVVQLQAYCARLFGKEAALLTCSGTMSNQIALRVLTSPGDEVILDALHHICYFEGAQTACHAGVTLNACVTTDGVLRSSLLETAFASKPRGANYGVARLICVENSISCHGGRIYPLDALRDVHDFARAHDMTLYMDGARLLNACVASGHTPAEYARHTTLLSLCFAKGLGAPFGSVLVGADHLIQRARRYRKWLGGGLHQAGMMAAGALYALHHHVDRLAEDHDNARAFAALLAPQRMLVPAAVETNIIMVDVSAVGVTAAQFASAAQRRGVLLLPWTDSVVRAVTHLNVNRAAVDLAARRLVELAADLFVAHGSSVATRTGEA